MPRITLSVVVCVVICIAGCAEPRETQERVQAAPLPAPAAVPITEPKQSVEGPLPARNASAVPGDFLPLWKAAASEGQEGKSRGYTYRYAASDDRVAALMIPRSIPRDDEIFIAVIVDLTRRAFEVDLSGVSPRLAETPLGNAIKFEGRSGSYYVLPIKNETQEGLYGAGEPHTLLVWREKP